jgi:hypothetical protein
MVDGGRHVDVNAKEGHVQRAGKSGTTRRQLLQRAAVAGAVVTVGTAAVPLTSLLESAWAGSKQALDTPADIGLAVFAQSVELSLGKAYATLLATNRFDDASKAILDVFRGHHIEHASTWAGLAGKSATGAANNALSGSLGSQLQQATDANSLLNVALAIENMSASTYLYLLGQLASNDGAFAAGSIMPIESQHAVVIGRMLKLDASTYLPNFENVSAAATPAAYKS